MSEFDPGWLFAKRAEILRPSTIEDIHKLLEAPGMRSLAGAWPDPAVFQTEQIAEIIGRLLKEKGGTVLQYGSTKGDAALRKALADRVTLGDGQPCTPDRVLITSGSAQALDLACRVFLDPGDYVMVGLPSYFGATGTIAAHDACMVGVPVDEDGISVEMMEQRLAEMKQDGKRIKGVYVIPNFQNPSGTTLSMERREKLLKLAAHYRFMIFEDDPYGELRFEGQHLPSLISLDTSGLVIHMKSASKTFSPGMRIAWTVGNAQVIKKLELSKQFSDISTNTLSQFVLLELIRSGQFQEGIKASREYYKRKRDLALGLLQECFPEQVRWNRPAGGFFIFITLPGNLSANALLKDALEHNIAFVSGPAFFVDGSGDNSFRLSYSQASDEDIRSAIPDLATLIRKRMES